MATVIRAAGPDDLPDIAALVEAGFAAQFGPEGRAVFRRFAAPEAMRARLAGTNEGWVAVHDGRIDGYVEMDADHLRMIVVDPALQGRGLGLRLMCHVLDRRRGRTVTLNSAPNADGFYRRIGFRPTGPRQEENGIVYTPMACQVPDS